MAAQVFRHDGGRVSTRYDAQVTLCVICQPTSAPGQWRQGDVPYEALKNRAVTSSPWSRAVSLAISTNART